MKSISPIFALYKPKGLSSNQALTKVKKILGVKKAGHAGTLDPLAEGVLVVGIGKEGTSRLQALAGKEKEYIAEVRLGASSSTDDQEGEKREIKRDTIPQREEVEGILKSFVGSIKQIPPQYSAVHVQGKRAYERAREGEKMTLGAHSVEIHAIDNIHYDWPRLSFRVLTGPGVYIRALARDIGELLGTGGYLEALERTRVGDFTKENSISLEDIATYTYEEKETR